MHLLGTEERLKTWLKKHGWPSTHRSDSFIWAISPTNGKIPNELYKKWDGRFSSFPINVKIVIKRVDLKSYTHVQLDRAIEDSDPNESISSSEMIPPDIAREISSLENRKRELEIREKQLIEREKSCRDWEAEIRLQEFEAKKSYAATIKIGNELDHRIAENMARMAEYSKFLDEKTKSEADRIEQISDLSGQLSEIRERNLLVSKVSYTIDKLSLSFALRNLKGFSKEELDKIPKGLVDEFTKFMVDSAERNFFSGIDESYKIVGESFLRLPDNENKVSFCKLVMSWLIDKDINVFNSIGSEVIEEYKESRNGQ